MTIYANACNEETVALVWLQWSTEFLGSSSNSGGRRKHGVEICTIEQQQ